MKPLLCLCISLALLCCGEKDESQVEKLYNLATSYANDRQFEQAIQVLQSIRINFEDSPLALKAENEISQYQDLITMLLANQQRATHTKFSRIHLALENYKARFLVYPLTPKDLEKLPRLVVPEWEDVWNHVIHYTATYSRPDRPKHSPDGYALASFGEDGLPGGEGANKDHFYKNGAVVPQVTE